MMRIKHLLRWVTLVTCLGLYACGGGGGGGGSSSSLPVRSGIDIRQVEALTIAMPPIDDGEWDTTAVRKVLRTFAFGGQATDAQIATWADMHPEQAIVEMLTFEQHNLKLSPVTAADYDRLDLREGTLRALSSFWSSGDPGNGVPETERAAYLISPDLVWLKAATSRGLNPFRQKIGLWETNYHMAVSYDSSVTASQLLRYYDDIMDSLSRNAPYQDVLSTAATSAAVAMQYGHRDNAYVNNQCRCNEDFAREYFQLFFGILGTPSPSYHETVTIKNMAAALTDMPIALTSAGTLGDEVAFGTARHYPGPLEMLHVSIGGSDARQRVEQLSGYAINDPESADNLPVMIVSGLADDNLNEKKITAIRAGWAAMPEKNLLTFLRAYAISTLFHRADRIKYWTSIERNVLLDNAVSLSNEDGYLGAFAPLRYRAEGVKVFEPLHVVFGGQTGLEAADSPAIFKINYDSVTRDNGRYIRSSATLDGRAWKHDWSTIVPKGANGEYRVEEVAQWLWNRLIGDGLKNFGPLEKAHVYALLATGLDLAYMIDPNNLQRVIDAADLTSDPSLIALIDDLGRHTLPLGETAPSLQQLAATRIGQAVNFIVGTPYIFADEGH